MDEVGVELVEGAAARIFSKGFCRKCSLVGCY
jgi:hypothetical protein